MNPTSGVIRWGAFNVRERGRLRGEEVKRGGGSGQWRRFTSGSPVPVPAPGPEGIEIHVHQRAIWSHPLA